MHGQEPLETKVSLVFQMRTVPSPLPEARLLSPKQMMEFTAMSCSCMTITTSSGSHESRSHRNHVRR